MCPFSLLFYVLIGVLALGGGSLSSITDMLSRLLGGTSL
jgi:hypothetical protein